GPAAVLRLRRRLPGLRRVRAGSAEQGDRRGARGRVLRRGLDRREGRVCLGKIRRRPRQPTSLKRQRRAFAGASGLWGTASPPGENRLTVSPSATCSGTSAPAAPPRASPFSTFSPAPSPPSACRPPPSR